MLGFLALLLGSGISYASGYRDISTSRQNYPVMAKYDSNGVLRYCDGKRAGKPVGGKNAVTKNNNVPRITRHFTPKEQKEQKADIKAWSEGTYISTTPVIPIPVIPISIPVVPVTVVTPITLTIPVTDTTLPEFMNKERADAEIKMVIDKMNEEIKNGTW